MIERFKAICAVHMFLLKNNEVLLLRRYNTGYEDGNYSVPAGHLDGGEQVKAAAIREAAEECGIHIRPEALEVVGVMHRRAEEERVDFFVATRKWEGDVVNAEPHKCDQPRWCDLDDLPPNTIRYVRQALANLRTRTWFSSYGWNVS